PHLIGQIVDDPDVLVRRLLEHVTPLDDEPPQDAVKRRPLVPAAVARHEVGERLETPGHQRPACDCTVTVVDAPRFQNGEGKRSLPRLGEPADVVRGSAPCKQLTNRAPPGLVVGNRHGYHANTCCSGTSNSRAEATAGGRLSAVITKWRASFIR